jgi:hypothetical protein
MHFSSEMPCLVEKSAHRAKNSLGYGPYPGNVPHAAKLAYLDAFLSVPGLMRPNHGGAGALWSALTWWLTCAIVDLRQRTNLPEIPQKMAFLSKTK